MSPDADGNYSLRLFMVLHKLNFEIIVQPLPGESNGKKAYGISFEDVFILQEANETLCEVRGWSTNLTTALELYLNLTAGKTLYDNVTKHRFLMPKNWLIWKINEFPELDNMEKWERKT